MFTSGVEFGGIEINAILLVGVATHTVIWTVIHNTTR